MRILIVEDNEKLSITYKSILSSNFEVVLSKSMADAKHKIASSDFEVVLLDIMLPDGKGYELIPFIKKEMDSIVIILSALEDDKVRRLAYEKGADDYMIKPITLFELEYKLKALKKRHVVADKMTTEIGDVTMDLENLTLSTQYNAVTITHSQGMVLKALFEKHKKQEILSKNELANMKEINKTDNFRIHTLVSRLRKSMEELESDNIFIENVYGKGYRLVIMK